MENELSNNNQTEVIGTDDTQSVKVIGETAETEEYKKTWLDEMIEREATPTILRKETTRDFCKRWGVPESTYYFKVNSKENWDRIEELCFKQAKKHTPDILDNLGERAKEDTKSAEVFLEFILEKKKRTDVTSGDKPVNIIFDSGFKKYVSNPTQSTEGDS
jgi:hypothetical protein